MTIQLELPDYDAREGFISQWEDGFELKVENIGSYIQVTGNKEGLISLARQLLYLAQDSFPAGYHLHYDSSNSLDEGSLHLVISKK